MAEFEEKLVYKRPESLTGAYTNFCPGCTHGIGIRLVAEVLDELNIREHSLGVAPVGCSVLIYNFFNVDFSEAPHGRAPAMATGMKRANPDKIVFTYQGDGDLAAIGTGEIVHAAARGEKITVIFINNAIYGMTGGQMAPTTLEGQKTTSSPMGRNTNLAGYPIRMSEMLSTLEGAAYVTRQSLHDVKHIQRAKKAILTAFKVQQAGLGFSLVELLSTCCTNWKMDPVDSLVWLKENMIPYFPLGDYKKIDQVKAL
jgi:2-oxoglutarate ferredoxin oxidoreductase subunit beta